jgi:hypothetical protein
MGGPVQRSRQKRLCMGPSYIGGSKALGILKAVTEKPLVNVG